MFCLFQYRVRPGEKCGFTTKSTKVTKRIFPIPSRDARCEDIHSGRRPSAGSDHTKPACLGRFSSFRSFCVFVPFVAIPGKDPAAAFCKRLFCLSIFSIHIDAQDAQDYFRKRPASIPEHPQIRTRSSPESASRAVASRPGYPVHPVHVQFMVVLDGSAPSWASAVPNAPIPSQLPVQQPLVLLILSINIPSCNIPV